MEQPTEQGGLSAGNRALWTSLVYVILASAWILGSDRLLEIFTIDQNTARMYQTWKGLVFVLISGSLLFFLLGGWYASPLPSISGFSRDHGYRRRIGGLIAGICSVLILVILVNTGLNAWLGRQRVLATAEQQAQDLVVIIQEQTKATLNAADLALELFADSGLLDTEPEETVARMAEVVSLLPPLRNLLILDAAGLVRIENAPRPDVPVDLSSREYFAFHRSNPSPDLYISQPVTSERTGELAFIVSRRLRSPAGEFAGVVSGAIDITYFESLFDQVDTRYQRAIVLARRDGTVLVRSPRVENLVGESFAELPLFTTYLPAAESGNYSSTGIGDGVQRRLSYGAIPGRDLVVSLSLAEAEILRPWRQQNLAYGSIALAVVLTILWLALLIFREISRREVLTEALNKGKARLQALSEQLLRVHEEERSRLAHELHDEFGQTLTAIKLDLQLLAQRSSTPQLEEIIALTSAALQQVRSMTLDLRPPQIDDIGLEAALDAHLTRLATQTGRRIVFDSDPVVPCFTGPGALACFRIVQEAVNNALKHAGSSDIRVEYKRLDENIELNIRDNGPGFDIQRKRDDAIKGNSLGLLNMEERARLLGGTVAIVSGNGAGVIVSARIPFQQWQQKGPLQ